MLRSLEEGYFSQANVVSEVFLVPGSFFVVDSHLNAGRGDNLMTVAMRDDKKVLVPLWSGQDSGLDPFDLEISFRVFPAKVEVKDLVARGDWIDRGFARLGHLADEALMRFLAMDRDDLAAVQVRNLYLAKRVREIEEAVERLRRRKTEELVQ